MRLMRTPHRPRWSMTAQILLDRAQAVQRKWEPFLKAG